MITAHDETRVAIVDNATGTAVNIIIADSVEWAQQHACVSEQTAYDVKGVSPDLVSIGWTRTQDGTWSPPPPPNVPSIGSINS